MTSSSKILRNFDQIYPVQEDGELQALGHGKKLAIHLDVAKRRMKGAREAMRSAGINIA
jgi:hypothetical protein